MGRPSGTVLLSKIDGKTWKAFEVMQADGGVYAVCLKGEPVTIRWRETLRDGNGTHKYLRSCFTNPGHAFNLAERLNARFNVTDFAVYLFVAGDGRLVTET